MILCSASGRRSCSQEMALNCRKFSCALARGRSPWVKPVGNMCGAGAFPLPHRSGFGSRARARARAFVANSLCLFALWIRQINLHSHAFLYAFRWAHLILAVKSQLVQMNWIFNFCCVCCRRSWSHESYRGLMYTMRSKVRF